MKVLPDVDSRERRRRSTGPPGRAPAGGGDIMKSISGDPANPNKAASDRRVQACVLACEGIPTEKLESGVLDPTRCRLRPRDGPARPRGARGAIRPSSSAGASGRRPRAGAQDAGRASSPRLTGSPPPRTRARYRLGTSSTTRKGRWQLTEELDRVATANPESAITHARQQTQMAYCRIFVARTSTCSPVDELAVSA